MSENNQAYHVRIDDLGLWFYGIVAAVLTTGWAILLFRICAWHTQLRRRHLAYETALRELDASKSKLETESLGLSRYRQAFDVSPEPTALIDREGRCMAVNPALARLLNLPMDDCGGRTLCDLLGGRGGGGGANADLAHLLAQCLAGQSESIEGWWSFRDRADCYVTIQFTPLLCLMGDIEGALVVIRDLTDRKRQEIRLENAIAAAVEANRAKSDFLATMSHELRTPLNGIIGMSDLLVGANLTEEEKIFVDAIAECGRNLSRLIDAVLDFAQTESGRIEAQPVTFQPETSLARVVALLAPKAVEKGLDLSAGLAENVPLAVFADEKRISQVLFNLVHNAIKFTEAGSVSVEVAVADDRSDSIVLRYDVIDTGIGIRPADQLKLFRDFAQIDSGTARSHDGAGLGLAISHRFVNLLGGVIGVESEFGQGSRFWFTVPVGVSEIFRKPGVTLPPQANEKSRPGFPQGSGGATPRSPSVAAAL